MRKFLLLMSIGTCSCSPPARVEEPHASRSSPHTQDAPPRLADSAQEIETAPQSESEPLVEASTQQNARIARVPWGGLRVSFQGAPLETAKHALIFLHGYGMSPRTLDRAEPLAKMLEETSLILPEAPYALGQAWQYPVTWVPFNGGHTAPTPVVLAAAQFIQRTTATAVGNEPHF